MPPLILILHHAPDARGSSGPWREADAGVVAEVDAVAEALRRLGLPYRTASVRTLAEALPVLAAHPGGVVFNLVETLAGEPTDFAWIPDLCRVLRLPCTGCEGLCQALCLDKWRAKALLSAAGLPTPPALRVDPQSPAALQALPPAPWIVKPVASDGSEGVDEDSVVGAGETFRLDALVRRVAESCRQDALIETYIEGREINVALLERQGQVEPLPIAEIEFRDYASARPKVVGYRAKWTAGSFEYDHTVRHVPARLDETTAQRLRALAVRAWEVMKCRDYARVDIRLDPDGRPWILEVNPNPDIAPEAGFAAALAAARIPYEQFVQRMIENALARLSTEVPSPILAVPPPPQDTAWRIRPAEPADRQQILRFVGETGVFRPDEIAVAREVLDDSLNRPEATGYRSRVADESGIPIGWICFGPTPCTVGTFDVYWIVVTKNRWRHGVGRALLASAEAEMTALGARLAVIETSSRPLYEPTRRFYERAGYREQTRLPDFYAPGDDKITYVKPLRP